MSQRPIGTWQSGPGTAEHGGVARWVGPQEDGS